MTKPTPVAKPAAKRPLSGNAPKAQQPEAKPAAAIAHEHVVLAASFEVHGADGVRTFKAGKRSLPSHLAAQARAKGLVAPDAE